MADFVIRIPRVSVAVAEAELTDLLVPAGQQFTSAIPVVPVDVVRLPQLPGRGLDRPVVILAEFHRKGRYPLRPAPIKFF